MQRRMISYGMMISGVLAMIIGFALLPLPSPSTAAPALQPSPRPTIPPLTILPASSPTPVPMGRVTGTIIDLRTHTPTANIAVQIGDTIVYSDANGNYDRWVESGFYTLALQLSSEQGSPAQPPLEIAVGPGDTVVAHLFFTSLGQPTELAIEAPTATPTEVPMPTIAPVAVAPEMPVVIPPKLPYTGVDAVPARQPTHLPRTATTTTFNAQFWFVVGFLLLVGGLGLQFWPSRRRVVPTSTDEQLLNELLGVSPNNNDEELLRALLMENTESKH